MGGIWYILSSLAAGIFPPPQKFKTPTPRRYFRGRCPIPVLVPEKAGKSHPWTNASVGETLEELSGPLVHTNFPRKGYGPMIAPYEFPPKLVWTNGAQSSLKVSVLTGIGP